MYLQNVIDQQPGSSFTSNMSSFFTDPTNTLMYNNINNMNSALPGYNMNNSLNYNNNINNYNSDLNFSTSDNPTRTLEPTFDNNSITTPNSSVNVSQILPENQYLIGLKQSLETTDLSLTTSRNSNIISSVANSSNQCNINNTNNSANSSNKEYLTNLSAMYYNNNIKNNCYISTNNFNVASNTNDLRVFSLQNRKNMVFKTGPGSNSIYFLFL